MSAGLAGSQVSWSITTSGAAASIACAHRLGIEGIGAGHLGPEFAETIDARAGARHAGDLMAKRAQRAHERQAHGAGGAGDEYLHSDSCLLRVSQRADH